MNIIERLIAWLEWNQRPCEERDLLNDALEVLEAKDARLAAAEADIEIYKRREEIHRQVAKMPCLRCGYVPQVVTLAENGGHDGTE